jgi:colicin import membrane protein
MNAVYSDVYKFPAGILALVVHGAFFALLYFGFTWQSQKPATMSVELWQSLPDAVATPTPMEKPVVMPEPVPPPVATKPDVVEPLKKTEVVPPSVVAKPDIVLPIKKPEPKPVAVKPVEVKPLHPVENKKTEVKPQPKPEEPSAAELQAERELAAQAAATNKMVDEYVDKIRSKIKSNIHTPSDVLNDASVEFSVTLLPGGTVLSTHMTQSSGNSAYENAVEHAILASQPLPLPPDKTLFNRFRELKLKFKPVE